MKRIALPAALLVALLGYLLAWPVPVDPVAWEAPPDRGLVGPYAPNALLQAATGIDLGAHTGPEDAALGADNQVYASTLDGKIIRVRGNRVEAFADVGGRPLGIETDADGSLVVANAHHGLQRIDRNGQVTRLGTVPANNLAIARDGRIFFTEPSDKFNASRFDHTLDASVLAIVEHGGHGRVLVFDPATGISDLVMDGLTYANGVAISAGNDYLLVAETAAYRVHRIWLDGPHAGQREVLLDNLPGFPDNLKTGHNGRFWLGLVAPRNAIVDRLSRRPWLRKLVLRLPAALRPRPARSSHVIAFDGDGNVLMNLQDPDARYPMLTGVLETQRSLYLTTLAGNALPRLAKSDL